jgi:hypothetical protein
VRVGDEIKDAQNVYYVLKSVEQLWRGDEFVAYKCNAEKASLHADRASTSGSWHTDSDSAVTDPRYRTKVWLTTYLSGVTGDYAIVFSGLDYPLQLEFSDNGLEVVCAVDTVQSTPEYTYNHYPYKFNESVDIQLYALDTATYTAVNLLERFEQCIREVATDYPIGSIREITVSKPMRADAGGQLMWQVTVNIKYTRVNDDYAGTETLTYGDNQASTFTFPNITGMRRSAGVYTPRLAPPGRMGNIVQKLGMPDFTITLQCDVSVGDWKRTNDTTEEQVFLDVQFNGQNDADQLYQKLNLGLGGTSNVTVEEVTRDGSDLTVVLQSYSNTAPTDYAIWHGLDT